MTDPNLKYRLVFDRAYVECRGSVGEKEQAGIDAVVTAVREDDAANLAHYGQAKYRQGRQHAARDIEGHAAGLEDWARLDYEHAARIARGEPNA